MICPKCRGVGRIPFREEQEIYTNEEWFDTLSTEEKAEWLASESRNVINDFKNFDFRREHKEFWAKWLKQSHREE